METILFLPTYLGIIFLAWFGIVGAILTLIEIVRMSGRKIPQLSLRVVRVAALLLSFFASAQAYKEASDRAATGVPPNGVVTEDPDHAKLASENRTQADELSKLRLTVNTQNERISRLESENKSLVDANNSLHQQLDDRAKRKQVRDELSRLLQEGNELQDRLSSLAVTSGRDGVPTEQVKDWVSRLEKYLASVDASYVARSRSGAGISIGVVASDSPPSPVLLSAVGTVRVRLARLEEFIREWSQ
jgi:predicted RNase H-like nuclease (RuvC/YqgF family)